jgi:hypothetical protein
VGDGPWNNYGDRGPNNSLLNLPGSSPLPSVSLDYSAPNHYPVAGNPTPSVNSPSPMSVIGDLRGLVTGLSDNARQTALNMDGSHLPSRFGVALMGVGNAVFEGVDGALGILNYGLNWASSVSNGFGMNPEWARQSRTEIHQTHAYLGEMYAGARSLVTDPDARAAVAASATHTYNRWMAGDTGPLFSVSSGFGGVGLAAIPVLPGRMSGYWSSVPRSTRVLDDGRIQSNVGNNQAIWTIDTDGAPVSVEANLREVFSGAKRSTAEIDAQRQVKAKGLIDDHAGHLIGHRFMLDQGVKNMFPQNGNFNLGGYKRLENYWADQINAGNSVQVNARLVASQAGRPGRVEVNYSIYDQLGNLVDDRIVNFRNQSGQVFNR